MREQKREVGAYRRLSCQWRQRGLLGFALVTAVAAQGVFAQAEVGADGSGARPVIKAPAAMRAEEAVRQLKERSEKLKQRYEQATERRASKGPRNYSIPTPPANLAVPPPDAPGGEFRGATYRRAQ